MREHPSQAKCHITLRANPPPFAPRLQRKCESGRLKGSSVTLTRLAASHEFRLLTWQQGRG